MAKKEAKAPEAPVVAAADALGGLDDLTAMTMGMDSAPATDTKGKSKIPTINIPELMDACNDFVAADREIADAEAKQQRAAMKIKPIAEQRRIQASREMGAHQTSIKVNGMLTFVVTSRYKKLADTVEKPLSTILAKLQAIFGSAYKDFFSAEHEFSVKKEATTAKNVMVLQQVFKDDPARREAIAAAIGEVTLPNGQKMRFTANDIPKFGDLISRESVVKPTDAFHVARCMKPEIEKLYEQAKAAEVCNPIEPSIKA